MKVFLITRKKELAVIGGFLVVFLIFGIFAGRMFQRIVTSMPGGIPGLSFSFPLPQTGIASSLSVHAASRKTIAFPLLPETPLPNVDARAFAVLDAATGVILGERASETVSPIASLTKLMTALLVLEMQPRFEDEVTMARGDDRPGGRVFHPGERVRIRDLFAASLLGSSNSATVALARSTGLSLSEFVDRMNAKAQELSLFDTTFVEPTGLEAGNTSTVLDLARLAREALFTPEIREMATMEEYLLYTKNTGRRIRLLNTDILLSRGDLPYTILGGKTGYTEEAGYSLILAAEGKDGHSVLTLILGSSNPQTRFEAADTLTRWAFFLE